MRTSKLSVRVPPHGEAGEAPSADGGLLPTSSHSLRDASLVTNAAGLRRSAPWSAATRSAGGAGRRDTDGFSEFYRLTCRPSPGTRIKPAEHTILREVIARLAELSAPATARHCVADAAGAQLDLGVAHGTPGVIAFLAAAHTQRPRALGRGRPELADAVRGQCDCRRLERCRDGRRRLDGRRARARVDHVRAAGSAMTCDLLPVVLARASTRPFVSNSLFVSRVGYGCSCN